MEIFAAVQLAEIGSTVVYTLIGVFLLGLCWWAINLISPFSVVKEIEHDQNTALAVLIGSVFLSLAIIIAAVIIS